MKNKILIFILILLTSCKSVEYVEAPLPSFNPIRPNRPTLEEVEGDVPLGAIINTIHLQTYAELLENYADSWENFYEGLKNDREHYSL